MTLLDKIVGDAEAARSTGIAQEPGHLGEPATRRSTWPTRTSYAAPGRRAERRRLRRAAGRQRRGAQGQRPEVADVQRRQDAARPQPLKWTSSTDEPDRAGQPGAVVGQRDQPRRQRGHRGDGADGQPDADLRRELTAPRRATTTPTPWSRPTAARPTRRWPTTTPSTARSARRSTVTPTASSTQTFDLSAYAGQIDPDRLPLRQRRRRQRGRLVRRRRQGRRHADQRRLDASRRSSRSTQIRPIAGRTTGTSGWSASTTAKAQVARAVEFNGAHVCAEPAQLAPLPGVPDGSSRSSPTTSRPSSSSRRRCTP